MTWYLPNLGLLKYVRNVRQLIAINGEIFDIHTYLNSRTAFLATQEQRGFWRMGFCLRGFRQE